MLCLDGSRFRLLGRPLLVGRRSVRDLRLVWRGGLLGFCLGSGRTIRVRGWRGFLCWGRSSLLLPRGACVLRVGRGLRGVVGRFRGRFLDSLLGSRRRTTLYGISVWDDWWALSGCAYMSHSVLSPGSFSNSLRIMERRYAGLFQYPSCISFRRIWTGFPCKAAWRSCDAIALWKIAWGLPYSIDTFASFDTGGLYLGIRP